MAVLKEVIIKEVIATYIEERGKIKITETPLVRCGECRRSLLYTMNSNLPTSRWCHRHRFPMAVEDDGFCSYGERRAEQSQINTTENTDEIQSKGEPMSDLIEREYLLNIARQDGAYGYVSKHEILNAPNAETTGALDDAIQEYIKDGYILAEPKVGKWIELNKNDDGTHNIQCTYCRQCVKSKGHANSFNTAKHFSYCPHCGAEMRTEF